jgi:hypothetical protein
LWIVVALVVVSNRDQFSKKLCLKGDIVKIIITFIKINPLFIGYR